jgi:hypothetical protein
MFNTLRWVIYNEKLNDLYCSTNIVLVIKSIIIRWAGHVACMGKGEACTGFWWEKLRERDHLRELGVDGRIILRWILRKWGVGYRLDQSGLRIGTGGGYF